MLEIDVPLMLLTAVVFLVLIAILNSLLYKPMLKFIDDRNTSIKNDEESTNKNASDLSVHEKEIEEIILNARTEANKIRQEALNLAKEESLKEVNAVKTSLEADYNEFLNALSSQKDNLKADLSAKLPELRAALNAKLSKI
ncbi:F0F1 ATP synthase subunit B' [Campylobacter concisus]|uniref:FoF1 ATP synthase subunit B' n=1 Tax=Campylobacter concisus TaxID=199 RepID=UPI000A1ECE8E|nr:FoF1 ATP synthase subunit B' [Campylobacter concisus]OSQ25697.1 F0F1 ATP synthase subunit B' [Campylobacter concisus]